MLKVSIVMVCYNAEQNIRQCLDSILRQTYPSEMYEVIIVDNDSTDRTQEIVNSYASKYANLRLVINPIIGIATSRNVGLREAKNPYIASTDSDCIVPNDWLEILVNGFERHHGSDEKIVAVGGTNVPPNNTNPFFDGLGIFLNTFLGSRGSVQGMRYTTDREVPHIPTVNVMHTKSTLLEVDGFDESFGNIGEDQDLTYRLREKGYRFYFLANSFVWHKMRPTYRAWVKNMFIYGKGRMWLMRKHPAMVHPFFMLPICLVFATTLSILAPLWSGFVWPFLYFPIIFLISIYECIKRQRPDLIFRLFSLYAGTHFAYGIGEIYGIAKNRDMSRPCGLSYGNEA